MQRLRPGRQRFDADSPLDTHWRRASCEEVNCRKWMMGWTTKHDMSDAKHRDVVEWVRSGRSGYVYTETQEVEGVIEFHFPPGQTCADGRLPFHLQQKPHRIKLGKPEIYTQQVVSGVVRRFDNAWNFTEAFNEEAYRVSRTLARL